MAISEREREERVFRYTQRYGQHPETEKKYGEAIRACESIENLSMTVVEIARMYGLAPECLRNQLKRHFPEIISKREEMRLKLGYVGHGGNRGVKAATVQKYAPAVEMLRDTSLTVREVAMRCGVSYQGLQQHLIFYHKDIADSRMLARTDALLKPASRGAVSGAGGIHEPKPEAKALYAPAVEMYRTTRLSIPEIARRFGLAPHNLGSYLRKWHRDDMNARKLLREKELMVRRKERKLSRRQSKAEIARDKYFPALAMLCEGHTISETATALGVKAGNLSSWLKKNYPLDYKECKGEMIRLPSGKLVSRKKWEKYEPIADYICTHPSKSSAYVAKKFSVPMSSMQKHMAMYYPDIWERHCKVMKAANKRARERKNKEIELLSRKEPSAQEIAAEKYSDAILAYASGEKSIAQVADECGVNRSSFGWYLRTHRPDLIENRRKVYAERVVEAKKQRLMASEFQRKESELAKAQKRYAVIPKYESAVEEFRQGKIGLKPLADKYGFCNVSLRNYIGTRYPELIEAREQALREELDRKYAPAVQELFFSKESIEKIARRHGLSRNGLRNYIGRYGPHLMQIHNVVINAEK